jgi:predicted DNA binding CopG/RHH family protein
MKSKIVTEILEYDTKDTSQFIDKNKPLKLSDLGIELPTESPTKLISLRLPTELLNRLKATASQNDISYTSMIKILLAKGVDNFI